MSNRQRSFGESRRRGWGMGLYRNRSEGWVGGVCVCSACGGKAGRMFSTSLQLVGLHGFDLRCTLSLLYCHEV